MKSQRTIRLLWAAAALVGMAGCGEIPSEETIEADIPADAAVAAAHSNQYSVTLNGTNEYFLSTSIPASITGNLTVAAWIKCSSTLAANAAVAGIFRSSTATTLYYLLVAGGATDVPRAVAQNTTARSASGTTTVCDDTWHFVASVYVPGSTTRTVYWSNGTADLQTVSSAAGAASWSATSARFAVGAQGDSTIAEYFNGKIDEVAVWNTNLSTASLEAVFDAADAAGATWNYSATTGSYLETANLTNWWRFGDGTSDDYSTASIADVVGSNALTGTGIDATNRSTDFPTP